MPSIPPGQLKLMEAMTSQLIKGHENEVILPYYIGGFIDWLLMGIIMSQAVTYLRFIHTDKKHIVALVVLSLITTTGATVTLIIWLTELFVWGFGTYLGFVGVEWFVRYMSWFTSTTIIVQTFYIDRACRLYGHWWPAAVIAPNAIGSLISSSYLLHYFQTNLTMFTPQVYEEWPVKILADAWLLEALVTDILITVFIAYGLFRTRTGWSATDSRLRKLTVRSFEAQVPALLVAIMTYSMGETGHFQWSTVGAMMQTKVYVLGLLVTLNIRANNKHGTATSGVAQSYTGADKGNTYPSRAGDEEAGGIKSGHGVSSLMRQGIGVHTETWQYPAPSHSYTQQARINRSNSNSSRAHSVTTDGQAGKEGTEFDSKIGLV